MFSISKIVLFQKHKNTFSEAAGMVYSAEEIMDRKCKLEMQFKPERKSLFFGALLGALIGILAFAPIWMQNGGRYMDYGDYFLQYVPFMKELKRMVASGSLAWSWNSFLGDGFVGAYSYYTVFNPFAWIVALFPDDYILYATLFVTIFKLAVCMVASMLYMRRFCRKDSYALIGALLYTFSGFTLVNTSFYFFLDVIVLFPFVMYGLEQLICEGKRMVYVLSLMLSAAINYYFFVSTVLLVVIYVVCRLELYKPSSWKLQWKTFCHIAVYSIVGTGLAGIALAPSFYAILGSGKATESIGTGIALLYWPQNILEHLRTLVAPIESGRYHAFFDGSTWSSTGVYLPVFGCICVIQWCFRKKDWLKKVCIVLTLCYFVPFLNAAFNLFSSIIYTRWLYGMALMFSLVTALTLEELECAKGSISQKLLICVTLFTAGLLLVPTAVYLLYHFGISVVNRFASACTTEFFMGYSALAVMLILTAANYIALWYIVCTKKYAARTIVRIVAATCALNFCVYIAINYDHHITSYSNADYYEKALVEGTENSDNPFEYRIDYPKHISNYSLFKNMPSVNYYNSLQNPGSSRFAQAVGIGTDLRDTILLTPAVGGEYTDALLSVKYYYDYDGNDPIPSGFHYLRSENGVDIYENENYIPMGFAYDRYCLEDQLTNLLPEERAKTMLHMMVVQSSDEGIVHSYLPFESNPTVSSDLSELVFARRKTVCSSFTGTSCGFTAEINLEKGNIVFFSIPNDIGWEITVNGEPANVLDVNYGLLGICCKAGNNIISAVYHTPGWTLGIVCSITSLAAWLLLERFEANRNKKKPIVI